MEKSGKKEIRSGVYLVVDPSYGEKRVLSVAEGSMEGGLDVLQLWASWKDNKSAEELGRKLARLAERYSVPFVVNNDLGVALKIGADGVHIDGKEPSPMEIRDAMGKHSIVGATCSTSMEKVLWSRDADVDYISFCSMYPSSSVSECDIVPMRMVSEARKILSMPIFASGGINLLNAHEVLEAGADGVAVISTIMGSKDPTFTTRQLKEIVAKHSRKAKITL
ncbi:MAG: thiamine phosphate synthase [Nitrososphaerales archaeon]